MAASLRPLLAGSRSFATPTLRRAVVQTAQQQFRRSFQTSPVGGSGIPDYAFAFDIDGVLVRSAAPLPGASEALKYLQSERVPFILLTNGGGKSEAERVADLQDKLDVSLDPSLIVQSHTPFADLTDLHDKTVLVVGGDQDRCRHAAQQYGFRTVVTPGDIVTAHPDIWPFAHVFGDYYRSFAQPLPKPILPHDTGGAGLKIDAVFVYNDPRDWGLDAAIILDTLLSERGYIGTVSKKNGDAALPNRGYLQDGQPPLFYSNPDLWWATSYHLSRLGQGGFQAAFAGLWRAVTQDAALASPHVTTIGKPHQRTYEFAEERLRAHRKRLFGQIVGLNDPLQRVYMLGDNPESDIRGARDYRSPHGSTWTSILLKTGVYQDGTTPSCAPDHIMNNVLEAVQWAVQDARSSK